MIYGAIMGDVINSTSSKHAYSIPYQLELVFGEVEKFYKITYQIYRGDAFTILVDDHKKVFKVLSFIRSLLYRVYKIKIRSCVGTGPLYYINDNPGYCAGPLLINLGRCFDKQYNCSKSKNKVVSLQKKRSSL